MSLQRYSFDALRCGACRSVFYCGADCQKRDWTSGGHRLWCAAAPKPQQDAQSGKAVLERMEEKPW